MKHWRLAAAALAVLIGLSACGLEQSGTATVASPAASTSATAGTTGASTSVSTVIKTVAPAPTASSSASGPIYYSMVCDVGGDFRDFPTYQAARKAGAKTCDASAGGGGVKHGEELTANQKKALTTAYGANYDESSLSTLFGICGGVDDFYTTEIVNQKQAQEAAGALIICPDHPNAKRIQANIDAVAQPDTAPAPPAAPDPSDVVTYEITGSAQTALVTYLDGGGNIGQENDVAVPWSKTLTITGEYRVLSVSAQNGGGGDITCTIKVSGKVVKTVTSKGAYAIAACTSS